MHDLATMILSGDRLGGATSSLGGRHVLHLVQGEPDGSITRVAAVDHFKVTILYAGDDDGRVHDNDTLPR